MEERALLPTKREKNQGSLFQFGITKVTEGTSMSFGIIPRQNSEAPARAEPAKRGPGRPQKPVQAPTQEQLDRQQQVSDQELQQPEKKASKYLRYTDEQKKLVMGVASCSEIKGDQYAAADHCVLHFPHLLPQGVTAKKLQRRIDDWIKQTEDVSFATDFDACSRLHCET